MTRIYFSASFGCYVQPKLPQLLLRILQQGRWDELQLLMAKVMQTSSVTGK
jgi:hypothetical protein